MGLRFLRLTTVYPAFAAQFLSSHPNHASLSYAELYRRFVATRYAECDYHAMHLRRLGHAAENFFASVEPLQKRWASEQEVPFREPSWLADITVAQVRAFRPDVLFLDDLYLMDRPFRERLRQAAGRGVRVVGWRAATTNDFSGFSDLDLVLTSIRSLARGFERAGIAARVVPHGFESGILKAVDRVKARDVAFSFAGGLGSFHPERARLVESLISRSPLEVWGQEEPPRWKDAVRWWLGRFGIRPRLKTRMRTLGWTYPGRVHPQVFGLAYYKLLARSRIVLNSHISCSGQEATNMRLFEATGMGACLLTDRQSNLREFFEPDVEVATYGSVDECIEKTAYLLEHEEECLAIAAAGQRRTLRDHTFARRVASLEEILLEQCERAAA